MAEPKIGTLEDIRAEIQRLQQEETRFLSPAERGERVKRRAQILGEWAASCFAWDRKQLGLLREHAELSGEGWLFSDAVLSADGVDPDDKGRVTLARQDSSRESRSG